MNTKTKNTTYRTGRPEEMIFKLGKNFTIMRSQVKDHWPQLTNQEIDLTILYVVAGFSLRQLAEMYSVSPRTISRRWSRIKASVGDQVS